jgi:FKBP-type peptidyl-prolyl cis-trans isomerase
MKALWMISVVAVVAALAVSSEASNAGQKEKVIEKIVETKDGKFSLKYVDLVEGKGKEAKKGDEVEVHYSGWLTDGKKFDSSLDRKETFKFPLGAGKVIKGWDEGVAGMKEGGKRKLTIPPELGYGKRGAGKVIPPDATLIFEVELIKVQ